MKTKTEKKELKTFVLELTHFPRTMGMDFGWGNGYVVIPKGHKWYKKPYDDIMYECNTSQELTFGELVKDLKSDKWKKHLDESDKDSYIVGFDTAHFNDTLEKWPKKAVEVATKQLAKEINK